MPRPGDRVWETVTPTTVAGSPQLSGWIETTGFTRILPFFAIAGGTTVITVEGGTDGATVDADFTATTVTSGTEFPVNAPFIRVRVTQTVADATKLKLFFQARA